MSLESDLAVRPTKDDVNPSPNTVFSSDRTTPLLTTKLSKADIKDHVKNFDSAATAYNTNGDMSSHTVSLTSGYDILSYGGTSSTGGRLGHNSGTAIDGMVVYRVNSSDRRTAWFPNKGTIQIPPAGFVKRVLRIIPSMNTESTGNQLT